MLFLKVLDFIDVYLAPFSLLLLLLLVRLLLFLAQQFYILDKRCHRVLVPTLLLLGHTLINGVH